MNRQLQKWRYLNIAMLILFVSVLFGGCKKNGGSAFSFTPVNDLTTKVRSSLVSGFVTDENDLPVNRATVVVGAVTITTDKYGYFEAANVDVVKNAATVTITKPGYFKGFKTFIAEQGRSAFFRIKLIPKTVAGTINAASGGIVTLPNGLSISIPANAVVNASSNSAYTGTINVAAYWINPTGNDLASTMPGDLRGVNTAGNLQLLTTYGMAAVELTGSGNELLQITKGKKATLNFPIPTSLSSSAPASIPLWYFDETLGLWKQAGSATKTGSNYVGEVSHFSFWNCDVPETYVQFSCTFKHANGQTIPYTRVKISVVNNPANSAYGYTDQTGYVGGAVPDNAQLLLEVFAGSACITPSYSQTFTTTNVNVSLGTVIINNTALTASVNGTVTNCNNNPVTNGYIIMLMGNKYFRYPLSSTGTFNFAALLCSSPENISLIAEDGTSLQQSTTVNQTIIAGANNAGNLQACGIAAQQFFYYTIDGTNYLFTFPTDSIGIIGSSNSPEASVFGFRPGSNGASLQFFTSGIRVNSTQGFIAFRAPELPPSSQSVANPIGVNITELGPVGQFMSGNFSGILIEHSPNITHNVSCSFRVRRY
jgi:hypothetical protein